MAKELYNSPFDKAVVPTPGAGGGTLDAEKGGAGWPMEDSGKQGLVGSPFEKPIASAPGGHETANMSELGLLPNRVDVKEGPASWSHVDVEPGVASPAVPAGNIDKK